MTQRAGLVGAHEHRDLALEFCDLKFAPGDDKAAVKFEGYASVWDRIDSWGDTVKEGAFSATLKKRKPMMFYGHDKFAVPGKWLQAIEDKKGLRVEGELTPGHSLARDVEASIRHGAISGLSIGGFTRSAEPSGTSGVRIIKSFDLYEISVVSIPAETEARIDTSTMKSMLDECSTVSEMESLLREAAGLSKSTARDFVARLLKLSRREAEGGEEDNGSAKDLLETIRGATAELSTLTR